MLRVIKASATQAADRVSTHGISAAAFTADCAVRLDSKDRSRPEPVLDSTLVRLAGCFRLPFLLRVLIAGRPAFLPSTEGPGWSETPSSSVESSEPPRLLELPHRPSPPEPTQPQGYCAPPRIQVRGGSLRDSVLSRRSPSPDPPELLPARCVRPRTEAG